MIHAPKVAAKYIGYPAYHMIHILLTVFLAQSGIVVNLCRQNGNLFMFIAPEQKIKGVDVIEPRYGVVKRVIGDLS